MVSGKKYGIGIIGCGTIADIHAEAIRQMEGIELVSVYSRDMENVSRLGQKFNGVAYNNWDDFINDDHLEIVAVCTPSGTHLNYGQLAAEAGKHVIVEKPIEVTLERGKRLIHVCKQHGVKLAVIFQNRFHPDVIEMKRVLDEGRLGKIFLGDAQIKWFRTQDYYNSAQWRGTLTLDGGGVLINQAIHTIDLLRWFMGKVEMLFGQTGIFTHDHIEGEDTAVASLRFQNGALGVIQASTSIQPAMNRKIEIHGEDGTAILNGDVFSLLGIEPNGSSPVNNIRPKGSGAESPMQNFLIEPHLKQFEAIIEAIRRDQTPPVSGEEALEALAIILAIYESAKRKLPVRLEAFIKGSITDEREEREYER